MSQYKIGVGRPRFKEQHNQRNIMAECSVEEDDDTIVVTTPYDEDWKIRAKEMGGSWDPDQRAWVFDGMSHSAQDLIREVRIFFPRARI